LHFPSEEDLMTIGNARRGARYLLVLGVVGSLGLAASSGASGRTTAAPTLSAEPSISGTPIVGNMLKGNRGKWNGAQPITTTAVWVRCDGNGASCAPISGATTNEYKVVNADLGSTLRFRVTAKNNDGATTADSNETGVVGTANGQPVSTKPPVVSGFAEVGVNLHTTTGTWVGDTPMTFSYQWQRCDKAGNACSGISGAKSDNYTVTKADVDRTIRVKVTATNSKGKGTAISDQSAVVLGQSGGGGGGGGGNVVDVKDIPDNVRLVVDSVVFNPNPVSSRNVPIEIRIRVKDSRGKLVRGALVFVRSTPIVTATPTDAPTGADGWVTYHVMPEADFPIKNGYSVQFYVKAYRQGDPTLGGISGTRLVQVSTHTP
jgi:hypothetical protein